MADARKNVRRSKFDQNREKYSIIILAAGIGSRLKQNEPKALIKLNGGETVLSRQLKILWDIFPTNETILVVGHEADYVMRNTPNNLIKVENERYEETNIARSLSMGLRAATTDNVVVVYGDLVFNHHLLFSHRFNHQSVVFLDGGVMKDEEVGCTFNKKMELENIMYGLPNKWAQIAYFAGHEIELLKRTCWERSKEKYFGFEVINEIIDNGGRFGVVNIEGGKCTDIDVSKDIEIARGIS